MNGRASRSKTDLLLYWLNYCFLNLQLFKGRWYSFFPLFLHTPYFPISPFCHGSSWRWLEGPIPPSSTRAFSSDVLKRINLKKCHRLAGWKNSWWVGIKDKETTKKKEAHQRSAGKEEMNMGWLRYHPASWRPGCLPVPDDASETWRGQRDHIPAAWAAEHTTFHDERKKEWSRVKLRTKCSVNPAIPQGRAPAGLEELAGKLFVGSVPKQGGEHVNVWPQHRSRPAAHELVGWAAPGLSASSQAVGWKAARMAGKKA